MPARLVYAVLLCATGISSCPNGWVSFDGSCYHIPDIEEDWINAAEACKLASATLAKVDNKHEENFVIQLAEAFRASHPNAWEFWLGGTDEFVEGEWFWIDHSRMSYSDWMPGEPNNEYNREDCLELCNHHGKLSWNDERCDRQINFICETVQGNSIKPPGLNNTGSAWMPIG